MAPRRSLQTVLGVALMSATVGVSWAGPALPDISVNAAKPRQTKLRPIKTVRPNLSTNVQSAPSRIDPAPSVPAPRSASLLERAKALDEARDALLPKIGASTYSIGRGAVESLPQGDNTPLDKVVLQAPGVSADSAVGISNNFHVRNEYANVQYRINGVLLPDGVSGFGPTLDTPFIESLQLLTGALPAQYGLRTAAVIDLTSRSFASTSGDVGVYGGSRETITASVDYGGASGDSQYFVTARGDWNALGIENSTASLDAIHDRTEKGKYFAYFSKLIGDSSRISFFSGLTSNSFQIPNNPSQTPLGNFGPSFYPSSILNENENERFLYNVAAFQTRTAGVDAQIAVFQRYAKVHFAPDVFGDLVFNDVASSVIRESDLYGVQSDSSLRVAEDHKLRFGLALTGERTDVTNASDVLPVNQATSAIAAAPILVTDFNAKLGWNLGAYVQDEWRLDEKLIVNAGLRFDQLIQYVNASQLSPRLGLVYKPTEGTSLHAGWARYFTPPMQAEAAPSDLPLFINTTNQPQIPLAGQLKPERANYVDVGVDQTLAKALDVGLDAYAKVAWNQLDDGQFGQAYVLTQFNFARGYTKGIELKTSYRDGDFKAYANFAVGTSRAKDATSNQYLLEPATYSYLIGNYHNTDDSQFMTASGGASYRWGGALLTSSLVYGSGLRSGFANMDHVPAYLVANFGVAREFTLVSGMLPLTARFDVVNATDRKYELRTGDGIGVFAPQYGARRGFFVGLSQKL